MKQTSLIFQDTKRVKNQVEEVMIALIVIAIVILGGGMFFFYLSEHLGISQTSRG